MFKICRHIELLMRGYHDSKLFTIKQGSRCRLYYVPVLLFTFSAKVILAK